MNAIARSGLPSVPSPALGSPAMGLSALRNPQMRPAYNPSQMGFSRQLSSITGISLPLSVQPGMGIVGRKWVRKWEDGDLSSRLLKWLNVWRINSLIFTAKMRVWRWLLTYNNLMLGELLTPAHQCKVDQSGGSGGLMLTNLWMTNYTFVLLFPCTEGVLKLDNTWWLRNKWVRGERMNVNESSNHLKER